MSGAAPPPQHFFRSTAASWLARTVGGYSGRVLAARFAEISMSEQQTMTSPSTATDPPGRTRWAPWRLLQGRMPAGEDGEPERRGWSVRRIVLAVLLACLIPVGWSYGHALTARGTDSLGVRSVEWLRDHG